MGKALMGRFRYLGRYRSSVLGMLRHPKGYVGKTAGLEIYTWELFEYIWSSKPGNLGKTAKLVSVDG